MGVLSKAKLAAKRLALKGVQKSIRDPPLGEVEAAARKPILVARTKETHSPGKRGEKKGNPSPPNLPRPSAKILPVTSKVVETWDVTRGRERRALRPRKKKKAANSASISPDPNPLDYGSVTQLRELLGLAPLHTSQDAHTAANLPQDALIVSIDAEWERRGRREHIVEIGITILDTRDIIDVLPGRYGRDWFARAKTYHYVVDVTRRPWQRMRACLFSDDRFGNVSTIRKHIRKVLQRAAYPRPEPSGPIGHSPRKVVLVGHSVVMDLQSLYRSPGLELDFLGTDVFPTKPTTVFDTFMLTVVANKQGAKIRWRGLGWLVNWLGVHPRYRHFESVIGCHNAGNDAAYAMMALLMYAIRWENIVPGDTVPLSTEETKRQPDLRSESHNSTPEDLRSRLEDCKLEERTPAISEKHVELMAPPLSIAEASAEAEQQYFEPKPLSSSSLSASTKAGRPRIKRKKLSLPTPSESSKSEPSLHPVSTGSTFWGVSFQKLTGWWRQS